MRLNILMIFLMISTLFSQTEPVGHWTFDDAGNLTKAEIGSDLVLTGTQTAVNGPKTAMVLYALVSAVIIMLRTELRLMAAEQWLTSSALCWILKSLN